MSSLRLHWLEAVAPFGRWRAAIQTDIEAGWEAAERRVVLPPTDVLVQCVPQGGIPELGMVGHAYRPGCFSITLDTANPNFTTAMAAGALPRQVVHEIMHVLRFAATGYDHNLGDALVSEGLCGRFVQECFGTPAELWEAALTPAELSTWLPRAQAAAGARHDHAAWFFGRGANAPPRWAGYTLGFHLVGRYLAAHPEALPSTLVGIHAARLLKDVF